MGFEKVYEREMNLIFSGYNNNTLYKGIIEDFFHES
jgi:hypothetical protein